MKELDPQLFSNSSKMPSIVDEAMDLPPQGRGRTSRSPSSAAKSEMPSYSNLILNDVKRQVNESLGNIEELQNAVRELARRLESYSHANNGKIQEMQTMIAQTVRYQSAMKKDLADRSSWWLQKFQDRGDSESVMQEMIDRHNSVIQAFENRMHNMQRIISEQEAALHSARAAIQEIRR